MSARVSIYIPCALVCIRFKLLVSCNKLQLVNQLLNPKHSLELLSYLYRSVIICLRNLSRIEHLLNLLLRVAFEILAELLKSLKHIPRLIILHFVVKRIHCLPLSIVLLFAPILPAERLFPAS